MMKATILVSAPVLILALLLTARAADNKPSADSSAGPQATVYDALSAFEFLKTMVGQWERSGATDHDHGSASKAVTIRLSAAGSAILETIYPGDDNEMLTVYHMNGNDLLLTHYCALQNAPVMKFEKTNKPGEIKFAFLGGTNFDANADLHVHEGTFQVKDKDTVESTFVTFEGGKVGTKVQGILKRKQTK